MPATSINKDIQKERNTATFSSKEFSVWWTGGAEKYAEKKKLENFFLNDPELKDEIPISYLSHKELYENSIRKATIMAKKMRQLQAEGNAGIDSYSALLGGSLGSAILKEGNPIALHFVMFVPTVLGQGTMDQQIEWLSKAWECRIIGTYAQTELGHGTFLRGLETRADYDPKTEEFILNSPTITSYKWWPGGLGHTANYAIVVAQLYTKGECHGLASFIVQLRDEKTHMPLPGINVGEIGTKLGMKSINNGYLGFKNVRIPRKSMLMKNSQVLTDGTYVKPKSTVLTYGTMMFVRVAIIREASQSLCKATTIATRYSAVRRQSPIEPKAPEPQIMDHVTQQLKLFPQIAKAIAFKLTGDNIWKMYNNVTGELEKGNLDRLPEMHALSCCLKAICSADAAVGVEICRMSCGGHGYMDSSNFPTIYGMATAACTYEGENTVMLLQTARYLVKVYGQAISGDKLVPTVSYLNYAIGKRDFNGFDGSLLSIVKAFQFVSANKIRIAYERLEQCKARGIGQEVAANMCGIELTQAADIHGRALIAQTVYDEINAYAHQVSPTLKDVLCTILELYLIDACLNRIGDFLRFTSLTDRHVSELEIRLERCLTKIRPNAVAIVDGFDLHDRVLDSALGGYDGNVYEKMFDAAKQSPLNKEPVNQSFHKYLKPFMMAKM